MLSTPEHFQPTIVAPDHANPVTLLFHGDELLMQEDGQTLPQDAACLAVGLDPERLYPVGILGERYFRTTWVARCN